MAKKGNSGEKKDRSAWWREARFGMFIHWGLYAVPAGTWKGEKVPGIGEWIMNRARIPVGEYEKLASQFNPVEFDAEEWVQIAKDAGMKYMVITAKHHDGFAIYDSPCSEYDIMDATPFGRDPIAELAKACKKGGIRLCFYYSQSQDWHDPDAMGNTWDFPDGEKKDFAKYLRNKAKPQVTELLTQYGPIGLIWFDTPQQISKSQSESLTRLVHKLQPDCLVSGRVGHEAGDYRSLGDNQIPIGPVEGNWETPATLNDTWGYKTYDRNWKSVGTLLYLLVDIASKGGNYLLNVGPTKEGIIPTASADRLRAIGDWMKVNGEAIHGTQASPYSCEFDWGRITQKAGKLYLLFYKWPRRSFTLYGLRNKVKKAYLLADKKQKLEIAQEHCEETDRHALTLSTPAKKPDKHVSVVVLDLEGDADVDAAPMQQPDGSVSLFAHMAELHVPKLGRQMSVNPGGHTVNWVTKSNWASWEFKVFEPGEYEVKLFTCAVGHRQPWRGGHDVKVSVAGQSISGKLTPDEEVDSPRAQYFPEAGTRLGTVTIAEAGTLELKVKAEQFSEEAPAGITLSRVQLVPVT